MIYAAEEPVTLAQLSGAFAPEALAARAERLAAERDQEQRSPAERGQAPGEAHSSAPALFAPAAADGQTAENAADEHAGGPASDAAIEEAVEHPEQVSVTQPDGFAGEPEAEAAPEARSVGTGSVAAGPPAVGADSLDEDKRLARLREREAREEIRRTVDELIADYDQCDRGMEIREIAGGYRVATRPEYHDAVRGFVKSLKPVMKLSLQALETLAVIAYKQPVTAPEISDIRGVDSGGVLGSLISRKLVTTAGRKQVIGRPILYKTTKEFLLRFGLKDLAELPSMEEFEKMAGELVEFEAAAQMDLPASVAQTEEPVPSAQVDQGDTPMPRPISGTQPADHDQSPFDLSPSDQPPVSQSTIDRPPGGFGVLPVSPELAEEREEAELVANARANVRVDDESGHGHDLPSVNRDTAGRINIDSRSHAPSIYDEDAY